MCKFSESRSMPCFNRKSIAEMPSFSFVQFLHPSFALLWLYETPYLRPPLKKHIRLTVKVCYFPPIRAADPFLNLHVFQSPRCHGPQFLFVLDVFYAFFFEPAESINSVVIEPLRASSRSWRILSYSSSKRRSSSSRILSLPSV